MNGIKVIASPPNASIDIVAVHGMNLDNNDNPADETGTRKESWMSRLNDLLPRQLPDARVLAFAVSSVGVEQQANDLLQRLMAERKDCNTRPIIFITQRLGGTVAKEALAISYKSHDECLMIWELTYAVLFFRMPHRESEHTSLPETSTCIVETYMGGLHRSFPADVEKDSSHNEELDSGLGSFHGAERLLSFRETPPKEGEGMDSSIVVDQDLACLGPPGRVEIKFVAADEPGWKEASQIITDVVSAAASCINHTPLANARQNMPGNIPSAECNPGTPLSLSQTVERAQEAQMVLSRGLDDSRDVALQNISYQMGQLALWLGGFLAMLIGPLGLPLGSVIVAHFFVAQWLLPSTDRVRGKAEQARESQKRAIELRLSMLEDLEKKKDVVLQTSHMLEIASQEEVPRSAIQADNDQLLSEAKSLSSTMQQELPLICDKMKKEEETLKNDAENLAIIEAGLSRTEGKEGKEFWEETVLVAKEVPQKRKEGRNCSCAVM